jgi:hypothetical protein
VLPLALFTLIVFALLAALLLDGAVMELRVARGDVSLARAQAAAESALADVLSTPVGGDFLLLPRGGSRESVFSGAGDTVRVTVQSLGGGVARVVTSARSWTLGTRADAATLALLRAFPDSLSSPSSLRFHRLPGWWWAQLP